MPDWTKSMKQTFEYYAVDPGTWKDAERLDKIESCNIVRDLEVGTLGSASISSDTDYSDKYVRCYLVTEQNGVTEKEVLGTHIYQTPSIEYSSTRRTSSQEGYTPLVELEEKMPPYGYCLFRGENIIDIATKIVSEQARAPVSPGDSTGTLTDDFVSSTDDTWLSFVSDLIANDKYHLGLEPDGRIVFEKNQEVASLSPIWTFDDGNSSILYPDVTLSRDLYGIPNVVEVIYSPSNGVAKYVRVVNDDPASPTSTVNRGRQIVYRDTSPNVVDTITDAQLEEYAKHVLKEKSSLEYTLTYRHGYCPVRIGDCVMLNYERADLRNIKAKVIRQTIKCATGCSVEETAIFSKQLWG